MLDRIEELAKKEPFIPYRLVLTNGSHYDVSGPQIPFQSKNTRTHPALSSPRKPGYTGRSRNLWRFVQVAQADIIIADDKLLPRAVELYNNVFRPKREVDFFK